MVRTNKVRNLAMISLASLTIGACGSSPQKAVDDAAEEVVMGSAWDAGLEDFKKEMEEEGYDTSGLDSLNPNDEDEQESDSDGTDSITGDVIGLPAAEPTNVPTSQPARSGRSVLDMNFEEAYSELLRWDLHGISTELYAHVFDLDGRPCNWCLENMGGFTGIITNETTGEELKDYMVVTLLVDGPDVYGAGVMMVTDAGETSKTTPIPRDWARLGHEWIDALGLPRDVTAQMSEYLDAALGRYGERRVTDDYTDIGNLEVSTTIGEAIEMYVADCTAAMCRGNH